MAYPYIDFTLEEILHEIEFKDQFRTDLSLKLSKLYKEQARLTGEIAYRLKEDISINDIYVDLNICEIDISKTVKAIFK